MRTVFAENDGALRRLFRDWMGGDELMTLERWTELMVAGLDAAIGKELLSRAHVVACFHASLLEPGRPLGLRGALGYNEFKEAVARAAGYLGHGRLQPSTSAEAPHALAAPLREICEALMAKPLVPSSVRNPRELAKELTLAENLRRAEGELAKELAARPRAARPASGRPSPGRRPPGAGRGGGGFDA